MKKYELTGVEKEFEGRKIYQIRAIRTFNTTFVTIRQGTIGGYIDANTILTKNAWIDENAIAINSIITGEAHVGDRAVLIDVEASEKAMVFGTSRLENVKIKGDSVVRGDSMLKDVRISGCSRLRSATICGNYDIISNSIERRP